jgi:dsDNA-specific endonuclease/ATPase MutS2
MQVGAWVSLLDDDRSGKVLDLKAEQALVLWDDSGFEEWVNLDSLVERTWLATTPPPPVKDTTPVKKSGIPRTTLKVVDLHAQSLEAEGLNLRSQPALKVQLQHAMQAVSQAKAAGFLHIDLIHGVGEGILKQKLHQWLRKNQYSFFDAPFKLYGEGATRVELKRKGKLL